MFVRLSFIDRVLGRIYEHVVLRYHRQICRGETKRNAGIARNELPLGA